MGSEISKKDITRLGFRSSLLQASFNYERMQAGGFTWAMLPILKKIYKDDKPGLSAAMKDNLEFINTHPNLVGFLMGLVPRRRSPQRSQINHGPDTVTIFSCRT